MPQPSSAAPAPTPRAGRLDVLLAASLCLLSLAAKLLANQPRTGLNHGDVSFYFTVARNLAEGRGFVIDYIWNFWDDPQGLPTPSNTWWMPLPSILCAAGMKLFGATYAVAQTTMIAATSLLPLVVWLLGRELCGGRLVPLLGAALATTFHLFLDQPCAPLSHGPYLVLASLALWLALRAARTGRGFLPAGAAVGLTQLARSDGLLLFAALGLAWLLVARPPRPAWWRAGLAALAGYALVMAPWWAHNLEQVGRLQPSGSLRAIYLREYEQWYSLPASVTREAWLADGWEPVLALKRGVAARNLETLAEGLVVGSPDRDRAFEAPAVVATLWLAWAGVAVALLRRASRRPLLLLAAHAALVFAFYTLVFTAVGPESFRTGMYSLYPALLLLAALALVEGLALLARLARLPTPHAARVAGCAAILVSALLAAGHFQRGAAAVEKKAGAIAHLNLFYDKFREKLLPQLGTDPVIMARDVHELHALTGVRCVQIPYENEPAIRETARRFGVTHVLLMGDPDRPARPGLRDIDNLPWYELVYAGKPTGEYLRVYRFKG